MKGRYYHLHSKDTEAERFQLSNRVGIKTQGSLTLKRMHLSQYYYFRLVRKGKKEWVSENDIFAIS